MSTLSLSAFTVERYIAICHPMKAQVNNICTTTYRFKSNCRISQYICTMSRARRIIISCWVFCVLYSSPWLALTQIKYACVQGIGLVRLVMSNFKYRYNVPFGKVLTISFNYGYVSQLITQLVTKVSSLWVRSYDIWIELGIVLNQFEDWLLIIKISKYWNVLASFCLFNPLHPRCFF